jgi:aspartyl-tRNA(Asn)/glutamyl-tRNA(Gln) amidotransferase subunit C
VIERCVVGSAGDVPFALARPVVSAHAADRSVLIFLYFVTMSVPADLNIDRIANLARIALTPEEKEKFSAQLADVLTNIEKLKQVDVTGVEPTAHAFPVYNVWAEDVAQPGLSVEDALRNAPAQRDNMIVVPKVVE